MILLNDLRLERKPQNFRLSPSAVAYLNSITKVRGGKSHSTVLTAALLAYAAISEYDREQLFGISASMRATDADFKTIAEKVCLKGDHEDRHSNGSAIKLTAADLRVVSDAELSAINKVVDTEKGRRRSAKPVKPTGVIGVSRPAARPE